VPFVSKAQQAAAFSGALGPEMKSKALAWAKETPNIKDLPEHVKPMEKSSGTRRIRVKRNKNLIPI